MDFLFALFTYFFFPVNDIKFENGRQILCFLDFGIKHAQTKIE